MLAIVRTDVQIHSKPNIFITIYYIVSAFGVVTYSEVRTFFHKSKGSTSMYKLLTTDMNNTISLSGNHLIYTRKNEMDTFNAL